MENTLLLYPTESRRERAVRVIEIVFFTVVLSAICVVYLATLIPDQGWGGDFAQYVHQAINIVEGKDMADTGYIYSRYDPSLGPRTYPPGFPLILAPVYALFGLDMYALQVEIILLQLLALVIIYLIYRREVSPPTALILLLMMGLSPYLISFKRAIMSDVPFMLASLSFVLWVEYVYREKRFGWWYILVAILLAFVSYLIRTVGFVVVGALVASDLIKWRKLTPFTFWTVVGSVLMVGAGRLLLGGGEESYLDQFANYSPLIVWQNIPHYLLHSIRGFWAGPSLTAGGYIFPILWLMAIPLIIYGFIHRSRRSTLFMELFMVFHLGIILIWPTPQELRFLYPILPLFLLYAGIGFEAGLAQLKQRIGERLAYIAATVFAVGLVTIYAVRTSEVVAAEALMTDGPYTATAASLFQFVTEQTDSEAILVFHKPRTLSLYTQRAASTFPIEETVPVAAAYLLEIKADYLIVKEGQANPDETLGQLLDLCPNAFGRVFVNELFTVYHIQSKGLSLCLQAKIGQSTEHH